MSVPDEIRAFHDAIARLPSVVDVDSGIRSLDGIREDDLRLPARSPIFRTPRFDAPRAA